MEVKTSLKRQQNPVSYTGYQVKVLDDISKENEDVPKFRDKLHTYGFERLKPTQIEILQINLGKMCNQTCKHCHVDAGPDRDEIMGKEMLQKCLDILSKYDINTVDLTGGAPEMNPNFDWFVEECSKLGKNVIVRCNLTIIVANKKYHYLPEFYRKHGVEVVSSLPFYNADRTDRQRGQGVFKDSVTALQLLNEVGYGKNDDLPLNLVYNPTGAFLPSAQEELEMQFKKALKDEFDIEFHNLYAITNIPISRFLDYLLKTENYEEYMEKLVDAFNPEAVYNVMCRNMLSISWDGYIYDCDFNQMLDLKVNTESKHIDNFDFEALNNRDIVIGQHCYGCTAGAGSSCGGATT